MKNVLLVLSVILVTACVHTIEIVQFDTGEVLQGSYNELDRTVTVTMTNGEVLKGKYSAMSNAAFTFATANVYSGMVSTTGFGYGITAGGGSQAYALLKSNTSKLMMEIIVNYSEWSGHGFGEARTNDGRIYKVQF